MYFETPITEWSHVAAALFGLTITIPALLLGVMKVVALVQSKTKN
jgi:hypothetical protein